MFQTRSALRWSWQRHAPKSRLLNFKGILKTATWDEKSREIPCPPCPSKLKEPEISNFKSSKHATLNCSYLLILPVKNCFQNGCDIGWGPQPLSFLTSTEAFAASSSLALSTRPLNAAWCSGVQPQHRGGRRHHPRRLPALSSRAGLVPDVHGRALRQEKGDDRRVVEGCCPVQRGPAVRPRDLEELIEAAPVAAQVAPHRRQVAVARRVDDVLVSARGEMQQKWSSSVP